MIERLGGEALADMEAYLAAFYHETIFARHDLLASRHQGADPYLVPTLVGYRLDGRLVGVQAFYRSGKWLPHFSDERIVGAILDDAALRHLRWTVGPDRVVAPLMEALARRNITADYDETEMLHWVDVAHLRPQGLAGYVVRRAEPADVRQIAELRCLFEAEYFGADGGGSLASWCLGTARRYVADGAYVAEVDGVAQAMVAVEAEVPELTQIGAVYTREALRGRGLAKAVVSAACREALGRRPLVTLTVHEGNIPALRAYRALGFQPWIPYRMCRLG